MPAAKLKQFLDSSGIKYTSILHSAAFTAQEVASLAHIPGREMAKSVVVFLDEQLALAVVPASKQVSLSRLRNIAGATTVTLAGEAEFRGAFPDCEAGAMPPFGNLYAIPVYVDEGLVGYDMAFNAGTHRELIRMKWDDFATLVRPRLGDFAVRLAIAANL